MKNIIIRKEWIEILEKQSKEFRNNVMGAIYDYALRGTEPTDLNAMEQLAFDFIKTEMDRLDESLDFDGAQEAAIKKKRAAERRAERAALKNSKKDTIQPVAPATPAKAIPFRKMPGLR
ncbi:MAG: hypothetical protein K2O00_06100 [Muribaculaceae bacterium]|nr:hypothetical protein [Muribaculaceae bacterium]